MLIISGELKKAFYLGIHVFSTKVLIKYIVIISPAAWSSEPWKSVFICIAIAVPSFLSY